MGIKDLNTLLKEYYKYIPKASFKGEKIALDFLNFGYISHAKACKDVISDLPLILLEERKYDEDLIVEKTVKYYLNTLFSLVQYQIIPITVFEGGCFPLKSKHAHIKREKDRKRALERSEDKKVKENEETYRSVYIQTIPFKKTPVIKKIKECLERVGLPYLECVTEAEHLTSALVKEGYAIASYTTDSDTIPLGCPFNISKEGTPEDMSSHHFRLLSIYDVKKGLKFNQEEMIDFCILASCDYNERIKMLGKGGKPKNIGIKTAYDLMQKYRSIPSIIANETLLEAENLEYEECKVIFNSFTVQKLCPSFTSSSIEPNVEGKKEIPYSEKEEELHYLSIFTKNIVSKGLRYDLPSKPSS